MDKLLKYNGVQEALKFLREDDERTLQEHLEMCQIPAPSYEEGEKAEYVRKKMVDAGLSDVHVDEVGNVLGTWKGTGNGPRIMVAGHTDTVFPRETDLTLKKEGERYSCPGIGDDTRAVAELLSLARAMKATGIRGEGDIVFCANVCEEGLGDLRGIKYVFKDMANTEGHYDGFVSIDDKKTSGIIYQAVGSERYLITFHGTGGHSFTGFGIPNPIHAMGRAIAKISDFQTPKNPKTTFSVGVVNGGTSVNVIAAECSMLVDMRSVDAGELEKLSAKLHQAIEEAVNEENARWGYGTLRSESTGILDDNNMTAKSSVGDTAGAVPVNADNGDREPQQKMTALQSPSNKRVGALLVPRKNPARLSRLQMLQIRPLAWKPCTSVPPAQTPTSPSVLESLPSPWAGEEKAVESIPSTNGTNLQNPGKDHSVTCFCCWRYRVMEIYESISFHA